MRLLAFIAAVLLAHCAQAATLEAARPAAVVIQGANEELRHMLDSVVEEADITGQSIKLGGRTLITSDLANGMVTISASLLVEIGQQEEGSVTMDGKSYKIIAKNSTQFAHKDFEKQDRDMALALVHFHFKTMTIYKAALRAAVPDPAYAAIEDDPQLPRVLLIGDSISLGYTLPVRALLTGVANVHRPATNCGPTANGVKELDKWLGDGKWAVIHFNFGLHDLKYLDANGKYVPPDQGKQVALLPEYEQNLRLIVERLKKTGAQLVWTTTTPVPDASQGRVKGAEVAYNEVAAKVMAENGIAVDNLWEIVTAKPELQLPKNVHFSKEGYQELAAAVAASINAALKPKP